MTSGADPALSGLAEDTAVDRRALLRAALAVTAQRGYLGTTVARVAEVAGVAPEAVEATFAGRAAMLQEALELAFELYCEETPTWKDTELLPDLHEELARRLERGVATGVRASDFWRLGMVLNLEPVLTDTECGALFLEVRERTRQALRDYWRRILPDDLAADSSLVELAVRGHVSLGDGSVLAAQATPDWELDRMMRFVARGVASLVDARVAEQEPT